MAFVIKRTFYDYFCGQKTEYKSYDKLLEGWNNYKKEKATDFDYGDTFKNTTYYITHNYSVQTKPQRPHARSHSEWIRMKRQAEEIGSMELFYALNEVAPDITELVTTSTDNEEDIELLFSFPDIDEYNEEFPFN